MTCTNVDTRHKIQTEIEESVVVRQECMCLKLLMLQVSGPLDISTLLVCDCTYRPSPRWSPPPWPTVPSPVTNFDLVSIIFQLYIILYSQIYLIHLWPIDTICILRASVVRFGTCMNSPGNSYYDSAPPVDREVANICTIHRFVFNKIQYI